LSSSNGRQFYSKVEENKLTNAILKEIKFMIEHGFYVTKEEIVSLIPTMIELLDGSDDIYSMSSH